MNTSLQEAFAYIRSNDFEPMDIIVPTSGGKDSQASLKLAIATGKKVLGLFCDTDFEHPITYRHVENISTKYNVKIVYVNAGSVPDKIIRYGMFPGRGSRHCTSELKIIPAKLVYKELIPYAPFEVWLGMRQNESNERKKRYVGKVSDEVYPPHEILNRFPAYFSKAGVMMRLPIVDWSEQDVFDYLDGQYNPLYNEGFTRVGCFPCLAGGDRSKINAFTFDEFGESQYRLVRELEEAIDQSVFTGKIGKDFRVCTNYEEEQSIDDDNPGCSFCSI